LRIIVKIIVEKIGEKRAKIGQALSRTHLGRQRHGANDSGSNKHAAQLALKGQFGTQRLLHPTERTSPCSTSGALQSSYSP
jgi:hypothetical protein